MREKEDVIPDSSYVKTGENCAGFSGVGVLVRFRFLLLLWFFFVCLFFGLIFWGFF